MAPLIKLLAGSSLLAGLIATLTSRIARRKRRVPPDEPSGSAEVDGTEENAPQQTACSIIHCGSGDSSHVLALSASGTSTSAPAWRPLGRHPQSSRPGSSGHQPCRLPHVGGWGTPHQPDQGAADRCRSSSESQGVAGGVGGGGGGRASCSSSGAGLLSRLLATAGRVSESLEGSAVSCLGGGTASSCNHGGVHGVDESYDVSSEEQDTSEGGAESSSRSGYGKSHRARMVDLWIESALLVSRDVRLDKRHFDRTTRQNLKKMRPASAQLILCEIADRCWDATPDIAREVHRLVSHAKAQDKFAAAPSGSVSGASASASSNTSCTASASASGIIEVETGVGRGAGSALTADISGLGVEVGGGRGLTAGASGGPGGKSGKRSAVATTAVTAILTSGRGGGAAAAAAGPLASLGSAAAAAAVAATPPSGGPAGGAVRYATML